MVILFNKYWLKTYYICIDSCKVGRNKEKFSDLSGQNWKDKVHEVINLVPILQTGLGGKAYRDKYIKENYRELFPTEV